MLVPIVALLELTFRNCQELVRDRQLQMQGINRQLKATKLKYTVQKPLFSARFCLVFYNHNFDATEV